MWLVAQKMQKCQKTDKNNNCFFYKKFVFDLAWLILIRVIIDLFVLVSFFKWLEWLAIASKKPIFCVLRFSSTSFNKIII